jgi:single-strand DNA-binding protein
MINKIILVGRITKDPELRRTSGDIPVVNFSLAVNRTYTDASGERKADFINCVVWRRQAENMERFVKKGMLLGIEGRLQQNQYETEQGTRSTYEVLCDSVQFLESKNASSSAPSYDSQPTQEKSDEYYEASKSLAAEEDLPF